MQQHNGNEMKGKIMYRCLLCYRYASYIDYTFNCYSCLLYSSFLLLFFGIFVDFIERKKQRKTIECSKRIESRERFQ